MKRVILLAIASYVWRKFTRRGTVHRTPVNRPF